MATSQNGYTASATLADIPSGVVRIPIPGSDRDFVVRKDISGAFVYLIREYHRRVEPIDLPGEFDDWSYAFRPVRGETTGLSNHASATAIDINATRHPVGVPTSRNLTTRQIAEVHKILDELQGVIRWGGDYVNRPDAMHFEINASPEKVRSVVARLTEKEDDMPDAKEIADAVWDKDINPKPGPGAQHDPAWYLRAIHDQVKGINERLDALEKKIAQ